MIGSSITSIRRLAIKWLSSITEHARPVESSTCFQVRPELLTPQEREAYHVLVAAGQGRVVVFPKVHLVDFLSLRDGPRQINDAIRMDRKRVDFLLCDCVTMQPKAVVELYSHGGRKASARPLQDPFIARALHSSGLVSFLMEAGSSIPVEELRERLVRRLSWESNDADRDAIP